MSISTEWNLSDLYSGRNDQKLLDDQKTIEKKVTSFGKKYEGNMPQNMSAADLAKALKQYSVIVNGIRKIQAYAYLDYSTHSNDPAYGSFLQHISAWITHVHTQILFFEIELTKLPLAQKLDKKELRPYRHFLYKLLAQKPHLLTAEEERILRKKSLTGEQALVRLYEQESSHRSYAIREGRRTKILTESELRTFFYDTNRDKRKLAAKELFAQFNHTPASRLNTYIYNMVMQDVAIDSSLRKYESSEAFRHIENEVAQTTVDSLRSAVEDHYGIVHDYYRFKKDLLKLKKLHEFDRYAPVINTSKMFTYKEAQEMILTSFGKFSPTFASIAKMFFDNGWIDVLPRPGKQGGAFCYYVTPDTHPYIMVNFTGSMNDIMTLAHELGHGIHAYMAREQNILQFDWPLTLSETASVFGEMIVFDHLVNTLSSKKEKLALYTAKIESIFATVFRQIAMYTFERAAHTHRSQNGELSEDTLNSLWYESQQAMFGDAVELTENEQTYWNMIPHVFRSPFYVYAYSFGELLTLALYKIYKESPEGFEATYRSILEAGGSASPAELMKRFKLDITHESFWMKGIEEIQLLVEEAKKFA